VEPYASVLQYVVIAVVVAVIAYGLVRRIRSRAKNTASDNRN